MLKNKIITIHTNDLKENGFLINFPEYKGDPNDIDGMSQIYIELHDGKIKVHVWNGQKDPTSIPIDLKEYYIYSNVSGNYWIKKAHTYEQAILILKEDFDYKEACSYKDKKTVDQEIHDTITILKGFSEFRKFYKDHTQLKRF